MNSNETSMASENCLQEKILKFDDEHPNGNLEAETETQSNEIKANGEEYPSAFVEKIDKSENILPNDSSIVESHPTNNTGDIITEAKTEKENLSGENKLESEDFSKNAESKINTPLSPDALKESPSMRGKMLKGENHSYIFRGLWALNDASHELPGHTGDFEFKLIEPASDISIYPVNGKYSGFFMLKTRSGNSKNEDSVTLQFTPSEVGPEGNFNICGTGSNKFGKFTVQGVLSSDDSMHIYKIFSPQPIPPSNSTAASNSQKKKKPEVTSTSRSAAPVASAPRESNTRPKTEKVVNSNNQSKSTTAQKVTAPSEVQARAQRASSQVLKCSDLLRELMKYVSAQWFSEPVDPIRMNIPDYPTIIKEPMDFRTIRNNLDTGVYDTPEKFASDMRLVFKNAITYNHMKDSPVHIAARELSSKFEDKYRALNMQWNASAAAASERLNELSSSNKKSSSKSKAPAPNVSAPVNKSRSSSGPRANEQLTNMGDSGMQLISEMQKRMAEMQNELTRLRAAVVVTKKAESSSRQSISQEPLTFEEKKNLISQIHKLPPAKLEKVVEIIQAGMPAGRTDDNGDEVEIPIDELDTSTLRRLQEYVEANTKKKPGPVPRNSLGNQPRPPASGSMSSSGSNLNPAKKARKDEIPQNQVVAKTTFEETANAPKPEPSSGIVHKSLSTQAELGLLPSLDTLKRPSTDD